MIVYCIILYVAVDDSIKTAFIGFKNFKVVYFKQTSAIINKCL